MISSYSLKEVIGSGGYGEVYRGQDVHTGYYYAVKISESHRESLIKESRMLRFLTLKSGCEGFPMYYDHGVSDRKAYLAMQLLGSDLYSEYKKKTFSLPCVIEIGKQLIRRLECLHSKGIIHRDVKPHQFLLSPEKSMVYLADFGLAKIYLKNKVHKRFKSNGKAKGSVSFASIHTHMGMSQSRRDDLESLFYSLAALRLKHLPWQTISCEETGARKWNLYLKSKLLHVNELFIDFPLEFSKMFMYIRSLSFDARPNYEYLYNQFNSISCCIKGPEALDWYLANLYAASTTNSSYCMKEKSARKFKKVRWHKKLEIRCDSIDKALETLRNQLPEIVDIQNFRWNRHFKHCEELIFNEKTEICDFPELNRKIFEDCS